MQTILTLCLALLLAACGGVGAPGPASVTIYGDSATSGDWLEAGAVMHASPTPVQMMNAAGAAVIDRAANGLQLHELLAGGPVAMGTYAAQSVAALGVQLAADPSRYIVIGVGMVDALFGAGTVESYRADVREAVATVRTAGKEPLLRGFNRFAANELMTAQRLQRLAEFEAALRAESAALAVPFLDVGAVSFAGAADIRADGLHPTDAYHQRIAQYLAARFAELR